MTFLLTKCKKCGCDFNCNLRTNLLKDLENQFFLCSSCKNSSKLYSKNFCLKQLLLSDNDLSPLKYLYNNNNNKKAKYYLDDDIENIIKIKFDSINKKNEKKIFRAKQKEKLQSSRKQNLIQCLTEHKLDYKPFGECFTYVKYGYPDIETVIKNEINKSIELSRRKKILYKELQKFNLPYCEKNSVCYDFINNISDKSLNDIINDAKIENFFINYTNYSELQKIYPDDIAKEKALANYISKTDKSNRHEIANKLINNTFTLNFS